MLLGLVLHSALTYNITDHGDSWSLKDPKTTHLFSDFLVLLIHSFRMPMFFFVAGFFGALLFYERSPRLMVKNRVSRIILPFIVFLMILNPIILLAFGHTQSVFLGLEYPIDNTLQALSNVAGFIPKSTSHLWFLYYLILITGTSVILGFSLRGTNRLTKLLKMSFDWVIQRPLIRVLVFSGFIFVLLNILGTSMVESSVALIPEPNTFFFYLFFYLFGWVLFKSKNQLATFLQYDLISVVLAVVLCISQGLIITNSNLNPQSASPLLIAFSSLVVCLFIFGITGLFIRYASKHSTVMRYISDASYWVYLIHLPIVAIIPAFIWKSPFPAPIKLLIVLLATTMICFVSYHYLVRNTFIGKFLNGKRHPKAKIEAA